MIIIPHGLPAKILAALQWSPVIDALMVNYHSRVVNHRGRAIEKVASIEQAAEEMAEAGYLVGDGYLVGWPQTWRLARSDEDIQHLCAAAAANKARAVAVARSEIARLTRTMYVQDTNRR